MTSLTFLNFVIKKQKTLKMLKCILYTYSSNFKLNRCIKYLKNCLILNFMVFLCALGK